jgi:predicted MPP superfamily phosphohydrolase
MPWPVRMFFFLALLSAPFQWYVARKIVNAVSITTDWPRSRIRKVAVAVHFFLALYPILLLASYLFGFSSVFLGSSILIDALLIYPFWFGIVLAVQLSLLFLAIDLLQLPFRLIRNRCKINWLSAQAWLTMILACTAPVYLAARIYNDTLRVRTRQIEIRIADLPDELNGLRIAQITDIHVDRRTNGKKLQAYVDQVNQSNPDLILFCGDLISSGDGYIGQAANALGQMKARLGVYAVLGDHDYFTGSELIARSLQANGVTVLENASRLLDGSVSHLLGSSRIALTGATNVYRRPLTRSEAERLISERPLASLHIFFTHQPTPWLVEAVAGGGYDLFIAGHTHGGQVVFPLPGFPLTGSRFETRYVSGFYKVGRMLVSTSNGLGLTLAPIRYHAPAEVTLIVVTAGNARRVAYTPSLQP